MDKSFLESMIPTSLGIDSVKDVRGSADKAEEVFYQRNDVIEKLRASARYINLLESRLKKTPSLTTQISIILLNAFGAALSSIGTNNLSSGLHITMLVIGIIMILFASALTASDQVRDFVSSTIEHLLEKRNNTPTK